MPEESPRSPPPPVLAEGCAFEGLVVLEDPARIDGRVRGRILSADLLWIGETARVEASVEADEVVVAGHLEGEVRARRRVELRPTARVFASLEAPALRVAEGSHLEGRCRSGSAAGSPESASPA